MPNAVIHHIHKRKRRSKKLDATLPYNPLKKMLDKIIYIVCILTPVLILPQIWRIWSEQNAAGISLITYIGLMIGNIIWIIYGLVHKEKPIIMLYIALFVVNSAIAVGRVLYG